MVLLSKNNIFFFFFLVFISKKTKKKLKMVDTISISITWLLLIHSGFLTASIASTGIAVSLISLVYLEWILYASAFQWVAIGWSVVSFVISVWTLYAIAETRKASHQWPESERIFGDGAFISLMGVTSLIALFNSLTK